MHGGSHDGIVLFDVIDWCCYLLGSLRMLGVKM